VRLALREMRRRPNRFAVATIVLTLLTVLLVFLGGLLDGLYLGSTGLIRAQRADVFVFSAASRQSFLRSRIDPPLRAQVEQAPGVQVVGGLGVALVGGKVQGRSGLADTAVVGYELPANGVPGPPPPGEAYADRRLEADGVKVGQTIELGPALVPVKVVGWVRDTNYLLQGALWVAPVTWRDVQARSRPDETLSAGVFQVLVVRGAGSASQLARQVDAATGGATKSLTRDAAILSLPGTKEQKNTFNQIIFTTFAVAVLVVGLFFALLTIERTALYGVLKAIGASTGQLFVGVVVQAVVCAFVAFVVGAAIAFGVAALVPASLPLLLQSSRVATTLAGIVVAAAVGAVFSLRRVVHIDPASAIGSAS